VRWSAAKGLARISERLPAEFTSQVVDTVIGLFSIHSIAIASLYDMPAIAESTWHGACLSCAELLRRGLIANDRLTGVIDWTIKVIRSSCSESCLTSSLGFVFRYSKGGTLYRF
jgi:tubulin-specific chaperone D